MKILFYIFLCSLLACNKSPKVVPATSQELTVKKEVLYFGHQPFTGVVLSYYRESSRLKSEAHYVDGLLDGKVKKWYQNKKIKIYMLYSKGQKVGVEREWLINGERKLALDLGEDNTDKSLVSK